MMGLGRGGGGQAGRPHKAFVRISGESLKTHAQLKHGKHSINVSYC